MPKELKPAAQLAQPEASGPPKAEPNRIIIKRTTTHADGSQDRTINLIEQVKPGLLRTYQETRHIGPAELPKTGRE